MKRLRAAWVVPMDRPPLRNGVIEFSEQILSVRAAFAHEQVDHDLGDVIVLPGLVNAHTHLELSSLSCDDSPSSFDGWLLDLLAKSSGLTAPNPESVAAAALEGMDQCLQFGVTTVGDISKQSHVTRPALRNGPLRIVSFGEVQAMAQRRGLLDERFALATDTSCESLTLCAGVTPHAPYTVEPEGYRRCLEWCRSTGRPLATHLAESPHEAEFLARGTGPFRALWDTIGRWDDAVPTFTGGPIRFAQSLGLLDFPTLLAHVNYADDNELHILSQGQISVVCCPRTHRYFGHAPHRWQEMLAMDINVAIGTDSCASSPNLNLVDDLRLLHQIAPDVPALTLWEMATLRAARAVQMEQTVGTIMPGKAADFTVFEATSDDPLTAILEQDILPREVWIAGRRVRPS